MHLLPIKRIFIKRIFVSVVLVGSLCVLVFGQRRTSTRPCPPETICDPPRQFDEYASLPWGDENARLDNAAINLQHDANAVLYLVAYGAQAGCVGEARARNHRAKLYLVRKRGIRSSRIIAIDGGYREESFVQIWLWPFDFARPEPQATVARTDTHLKDCHLKTRRGKLRRA